MLLLNKFCYLFYHFYDMGCVSKFVTKEITIANFNTPRHDVCFRDFDLKIWNLRREKRYHKIETIINYNETRTVQSVKIDNNTGKVLKINVFKKFIELEIIKTKCRRIKI